MGLSQNKPISNTGLQANTQAANPTTSLSVNQQVHNPQRLEGSGSSSRRLPDDVYIDRRARGLCFTCNGKWDRQHVCPGKQKLLLMLVGDEEEDAVPETETEGFEDASDRELHAGGVHLSMHSLMGLTSKRTMKVWGEIEGNRVVTLIDCGASNNFIKSEVAQQLGLVITETPVYQVEVGDGHNVTCQGVCKGVEMMVQGHKIVQDFHLFELGGIDVVLGLDWLTNLGEIKANFKNLTLSYGDGGREVTLRRNLH